MIDFEQALKEVILGKNEKFLVADSDLHTEVAAASQALGRISKGKASLVLEPVQESEEGITYRLMLTAKDYADEVGAFTVPSDGYPIIAVPTVQPYHAEQEKKNPLNNKEALRGYFVSMASNPDSPLVMKLAFVIRRKADPSMSVG
jgi:hypothetical protein